jgi:hypothetical protein
MTMDRISKWEKRKMLEYERSEREPTYRVVRYFIGKQRQVLCRGLNLKQARIQCRSGSSGPDWWDGYEIEE